MIETYFATITCTIATLVQFPYTIANNTVADQQLKLTEQN